MNGTLLDAGEVRLALGAPEPLRTFNRAGVLAAADVHVARRVGALAEVDDGALLLALALAVRAPRLGHVHVDLATIAATATVDADEGVDLSVLPWPEPDPWIHAVAGSPLVSAAAAPLRLEGSKLTVERLWAAEARLAAELRRRASEANAVDPATLTVWLERLFPARDDADQRRAAGVAAERRLAVIAGGPGTGKTATVARLAALLIELAAAAGVRPPRIALAAPTGKAATRLVEEVHAAAPKLPVSADTGRRMRSLEATTLHRLLGLFPGDTPRHGAAHRLPHDVVVVDETSMVSLLRMEQLVAAVRPEARLVLVGDPAQLASIEAGAVLGDIVGAGTVPARAAPPRIAGSIAVLERGHRFGGAIADLAAAVRSGDADRALHCLAADGEDVRWLDQPVGAAAEAALQAAVVATGRAVNDAARAGDGARGLEALGGYRILCAHRHGPYGVSALTAHSLAWLEAAIPGFDPVERFFLGRPLLVTANDPELGLSNGDTGVVIRADAGGPVAAFTRRGSLVTFSPTRLSAVETVYAMTIHKSQGSQFESVAVVLPPPESRLLTRELLYTAITRATRSLLVIGSEASIRAAVERPIARASGLRERLVGA